MNRRDLLWLFALALLVNALFAWPIRQPGTMDSHYYTGGGRHLLEYGAWVEPVIWNYLDAPAALPAPSHLYWMPLPSLLVAIAGRLLGGSFRAAQVPFWLLASLLPPLSYIFAWQLGRQRRHAWTAGLLALFSGFFVPYWSLPETFAPFALLGGGALLALGRWLESHKPVWALLAGLAAGLAHVTRADGLLLLLVGLACLLWGARQSPPEDNRPRGLRSRPGAQRAWRPALLGLALLLGGYVLAAGLWLWHVYRVTGAPLSTAGTQTIWLRSYDELYSYGTPLTAARYLAWGPGPILRSKLAALWSAVQTFVAVDNLVFLVPLTLVGLWGARRRPLLQPLLLYLLALYAAMTLVFTFPGERGGLFHSSAALLPGLFAAAMLGLDAAVDWVARRRPVWNRRLAQRVFAGGAVALALMLTLVIYSQRVIGEGTWADPDWNRTDATLRAAGDWLDEHAGPTGVVMVGNPPAWNTWTGRAAVALPNEGIERTLEAARRYHVRYLVLDANRPAPLAGLYAGTESDPALERIGDERSGAPAGIVIYRLLEAEP